MVVKLEISDVSDIVKSSFAIALDLGSNQPLAEAFWKAEFGPLVYSWQYY